MELAHLGTRTRGLWTRDEALLHVSPEVLRRLLTSCTWQRPFAGVYADGGHVLDAEQEAFAAVLATGRDAVACGLTAARVWGLVLIDDHDPATRSYEEHVHHVSCPRPLGMLHGRERLVRHRFDLRPSEIVCRDGLWLTTLPRTVADCAGLLSFEALVCLLDDVLHRGLLQSADLPVGTDRLRRAVAATDGRAESPAETLARLLLLPHLPGLVPQVRLRDRHDRIVARFDLADERARLAVETDGRAGHEGLQMVARDRRRDRTAESYGWWTERLTWADLRLRPDQSVAQVVDRHRWWSRRAA